jgi:cell division protease FtsH
MFMPKKDILNHSKRRLLNQICCGLGGRGAEEIVNGDQTSGASGDIRMVTSVARHMVCEWGMSELGPIAYGDSQSHAYMGQMASGAKDYSEATAQRIDKIILEIVEEQQARCMQLLNEHRTALDLTAEALLEHETIDGIHVKEIIEFGEMRSPIVKRSLDAPEDEDDISQDALAGEKKPDEGPDNGLAQGGVTAGAPA